jgi:hypothetical protein
MPFLDLAGFFPSFAAMMRAFDDDVVRVAEKAVVDGSEDVWTLAERPESALEPFLAFVLLT